MPEVSRTIIYNASRIRSRVEYLIQIDDIVVFVWHFKLTGKNLTSSASFGTFLQYDLLIICWWLIFLGTTLYVSCRLLLLAINHARTAAPGTASNGRQGPATQLVHLRLSGYRNNVIKQLSYVDKNKRDKNNGINTKSTHQGSCNYIDAEYVIT